MNIKELEIRMWEAAKTRNPQAFLDVVDENAVMVCGGYRCSGMAYAEIVKVFDAAWYKITNFEIVADCECLCQVHYVIEIAVADSANADLGGAFHVTSTWEKRSAGWKLVFNMDSRIIQ